MLAGAFAIQARAGSPRLYIAAADQPKQQRHEQRGTQRLRHTQPLEKADYGTQEKIEKNREDDRQEEGASEI